MIKIRQEPAKGDHASTLKDRPLLVEVRPPQNICSIWEDIRARLASPELALSLQFMGSDDYELEIKPGYMLITYRGR